MAIRELNNRLDIPSVDIGRPAANDTALVFVLNRPFLWPFKVLLYSLAKSGSFLTLPILVISEDESLAKEPIVQLLADTFIHVDADRLADFSKISGEHVHRSLKVDWIAKYTLLKWLAFEDYGFNKHIYLDCDLVCINDANALTEHEDGDLLAGPLFDPSLMRDSEKKRLPLAKREENILSFISQTDFRKLNSGVMVMGKRLLDGHFRNELIRTAESIDKFRTEQQIIRMVLETNKDYVFRWLSPYFNYHWSYLAGLSVQAQCELLSEVSLLHFVGSSNKPWQITDAPTARLIPHGLWTEFANEAQAADAIFAKP